MGLVFVALTVISPAAAMHRSLYWIVPPFVRLPASRRSFLGNRMLVVNSRLRIPKSEFQWTFVRSSGPGGQNVNKVNSKAVLRWCVTRSNSLPPEVRDRFLARYRSRITADGDLIVTSQRYRDQARNTADALEKLRDLLAAVAAPAKKRRATKPSRASVARRIESKQARSRTKQMRRTVGDD